MKRCICHFAKWQIHPFISKRTIMVFNWRVRRKTIISNQDYDHTYYYTIRFFRNLECWLSWYPVQQFAILGAPSRFLGFLHSGTSLWAFYCHFGPPIVAITRLTVSAASQYGAATLMRESSTASHDSDPQYRSPLWCWITPKKTKYVYT